MARSFARGLMAVIAAVALTAAPGGPGTALAAEPPTPVGAAVGLPDGWTVTPGDDGTARLTWRSPAVVPMGGARIEVVLGEQPLGLGQLSRDRRSVTVTVPGRLSADPGVDWSGLGVLAAGRRLDADPAAVVPEGVVPEGLLAEAATAEVLDADPGTPGTWSTTAGEYRLADLAVPGLPAPVEVQAVVVAPVGAPGPRPLALFLHGRHTTCYSAAGESAGESTGEWPCPRGYAPVPSHRGYLQTQELLASQGYVTVSVAANGVNGQDGLLDDGGAAARAVLVRHHLQLWAGWSASAAARATAPAVVRTAPPADLGRVLLVGHSRGGEGMNRAALDSTTGDPVPWTVRGVVHIAPTAFGQNPAPGVPVVVLLPYCDGDVFDLQGQAYLDAARQGGADPALRSAVLVLGANHNYFNAEWTPGSAAAPAEDDWPDPTDRVCGTGSAHRLTAAQQRQVGATYTAAAAAVFVADDATARPLLDGARVRAASAGSARVLTQALGGRRTPLLVPTGALQVAARGAVDATVCKTAETERTQRRCAPDAGWGTTPHFLPVYGAPGEPSRHAVAVSWSGTTGVARLPLGRGAALSGAQALELRVVSPPREGATFGVRLVDTSGRSVTLPDVHLGGLPGAREGGASLEGKYWARDVRLPLGGAAMRTSRVDLGALARLELLPRSGTGRLWLLDAWGWTPGPSAAPALRLPRVDVGRISVPEGSADHVVQVPLTVSGSGSGRAAGRVWISVQDPLSYDGPRTFVADVPVGARRVDVAVPVSGDRRDDFDELRYVVAIEAVRGVCVGDYTGGATVLDDDPTPTVTVRPVAADVVEGRDLVWRLVLSAPSDIGVWIPLAAVAPDPGLGREVDTADLSADWLAEHGIWDLPTPPMPLSAAGPVFFTYLDPGVRTLDLRVPTLVDRRTEGTEVMALAVTDDAPVAGLPAGTRLVGSVRDPA